MEYMLMFYMSPQEFENREDPQKYQAFWGAFGPYFKAVQEAGIFVSGAGLQAPATSTTLRKGADGYKVQDGPFADSKEQLAGYFVIKVPDLDTALQWASRYPAGIGGAVEVRPVLSQEARERVLNQVG
jgi:hypothetical protein